MKRPTLYLALVPTLALAAGIAAAQGSGGSAAGQRVVVPLSEPGRPVDLRVDLFSGAIEVVGYDGDEVIVVANSPSREMHEQRDSPSGPGGMKRIPNTSLGLTIEERANRVYVSGEAHNRTVNLKIQVPYETSAHLSSVNHGQIVVRGLRGEHEIENTNGGIEATDMSGSVVANTTNGTVKVTFVEITPNKAMAFTTLNGNVDVSFPPDLEADLRISPGRGEILTDFDVTVQPVEPEVQRGERGGGYRVELNQDVHATVGGGGPTIRMKTFNGNVFIRETQI